MSETIVEELRVRLAQGVQDANRTRYVSAVGLVLLLYDHIQTFADEVEVIWSAKPSFAKQIFLLNRYIVLMTQICVATFMNHFGTDRLSDSTCQVVITTAFVLGVCSIACGNILVILRVTSLWDRSQCIVRLMVFGFCASFISTVVFMIVILTHAFSGFTYVPFAHTCVSATKSPALPGVWVSSLVFEAMVLVFVIWNALQRPRDRGSTLRHVLFRDGILFFATLAGLRTANLVVSIYARPSLVMCGVFFVWAMTTLVLNRSLLSIHKAPTTNSTHRRSPSVLLTNDPYSLNDVPNVPSVQLESYRHSANVPFPVQNCVKLLSPSDERRSVERSSKSPGLRSGGVLV